MALTNRQFKILRLLCNAKDYLTASQIAKEADCSVKTVRNELSTLEKLLENDYQIKIESKPNRGSRIQLHKMDADDLFLLLSDHNSQQDVMVQGSWGNAIKPMIFMLLKRQSITVSEFEDAFYASRNLIDKSLVEIADWLNDQNIILSKRRGIGLCISFREFDYRMAMLKLWVQYNQQPSDLKYPNDDIYINTIRYFFDGFEATPISELLQTVERKFNLIFSFDSHTRLLFMLSIMIFRARKNQMLTDEICLNPAISRFESEMVNYITDWSSENYRLSLSKFEKSFIALAIRISDIERFTDLFRHDQFIQEFHHLLKFSQRMITFVGGVLYLDFTDDKLLPENLMLSLRSNLSMLQSHIQVKSSFLHQIRQRYAKIYVAVWSTGPMVEEEFGLNFGSDEFSLISLHFINAIERAGSIIRASIICNLGIGITQLLREEIERSVFGLQISATYNTREIEQVRTSDCDFYIAFVQFPNKYHNRDVIHLSNFTIPLDTQEIQKKVSTYRQKKMSKPQDSTDNEEYQLFSPDLVLINPEVSSKDGLLTALCNLLYHAGHVNADYENSARVRENTGTTYVGKAIALPHGSPKFVINPKIAIAVCKEPLLWDGNNRVRIVFLQAINFENQSDLKQTAFKFYSLISKILGNDLSTNEMILADNSDQVVSSVIKMMNEV
ncbi:MAG TPA: hypothetical protein DCM45_01335 [Clostridiales bacterium]|nr:hypothetical protein [Clostridiales bacterium]